MRTPEDQANFDLVCRLVDQVRDRLARGPFASLTNCERTVWTVWWLEAGVNNGGFDQYFFNSAGDLAGGAAEALRNINAARCAEIVAQAIAVFPAPGPSPERAARIRQLEALSLEQKERLNTLTNRFYEYPDPLEPLLADYARRHPQEFSVLDPSQAIQGVEVDAEEEEALARAVEAEVTIHAPGWQDRVRLLARELEARKRRKEQ
jgi:hypothetical protein